MVWTISASPNSCNRMRTIKKHCAFRGVRRPESCLIRLTSFQTHPCEVHWPDDSKCRSIHPMFSDSHLRRSHHASKFWRVPVKEIVKNTAKSFLRWRHRSQVVTASTVTAKSKMNNRLSLRKIRLLNSSCQYLKSICTNNSRICFQISYWTD